jgi:hypothetical protein
MKYMTKKRKLAVGRLESKKEIPIASKFITPQQLGELQKHADKVYGTPELVWDANPALERLLSNPLESDN